MCIAMLTLQESKPGPVEILKHETVQLRILVPEGKRYLKSTSLNQQGGKPHCVRTL